MRHRKKKTTLDRKREPRMAMLRNLATSVILYEKVKTTKVKAKAVQPHVEKMITLGKKNTLAARRQAHKFFYIENPVKKIFDELAPRYKDRHGGYTRVTRIGTRRGDTAEMVLLELLK
ncbi:50S ribosomal protein L17 [Patescibacteria group bacterium]|nr:50S ribosomal protein L17 [Patescibacteria group bacterium]MBU1922199.1 50S ribosomal protein L17 [Patescibacteria group bacterium]